MRRTIVLLITMALTLLVASGVALAVTKIGTSGPDTLRGTNGADNLLGNGGNDVLYAFGGKDNLLGGEGKDWVLGGNERRALAGIKYLVNGDSGTDRMLGGGGGDQIVDGAIGEGSKDDVLSGGEGDDILIGDHVPAVKDRVSCGGGFDRVVADSKDTVSDDCEKVLVVHGSKKEVRKQEDAFFKSLPPATRKFFDTFFEEQLAPFPNG